MVGTDDSIDLSLRDKSVEVSKAVTYNVVPLETAVPPFAVITDKIAKYCQTNKALLNTIDDGLCTSEQLVSTRSLAPHHSSISLHIIYNTNRLKS